MNTRTERDEHGEIGIVEHDGKEYAARGATVTPEYAVAYPAKGGILCSWGGDMIGRWRATASWPVRSYMGSRMYQIEAVIDGRTYTGRGFGEGMLWKGKAKRS